MAICYFLLIAMLISSNLAGQCPVCEDEVCEEPVWKDCVHNDPGNPTPPSTNAPTSSSTPTSSTPASSTQASSTPTLSTTVPTTTTASTTVSTTTTASTTVSTTTTASTPGSSTPASSTPSLSATTPSEMFKCLHVEFKTPGDNETHIQEYCIDGTRKDEICNRYEDAVGDENVLDCSVSSPSSAIPYSLQSAFAITLLTVVGKIFI